VDLTVDSAGALVQSWILPPNIFSPKPYLSALIARVQKTRRDSLNRLRNALLASPKTALAKTSEKASFDWARQSCSGGKTRERWGGGDVTSVDTGQIVANWEASETVLLARATRYVRLLESSEKAAGAPPIRLVCDECQVILSRSDQQPLELQLQHAGPEQGGEASRSPRSGGRS
jgi:hypothetical protein